MSRSSYDFAFAGEANDAAARLSKSPLPAIASTALDPRHRESDAIMEALLRECLTARRTADPGRLPLLRPMR
jgi:hypothetical protein